MKRSAEITGVGILAGAALALLVSREFCPSKEVIDPRNETRAAVSAVSDGGAGDGGLRFSFPRDSGISSGLQPNENTPGPPEASGNLGEMGSDELGEKEGSGGAQGEGEEIEGGKDPFASAIKRFNDAGFAVHDLRGETISVTGLPEDAVVVRVRRNNELSVHFNKGEALANMTATKLDRK